MKTFTSDQITEFQEHIYSFYAQHKRAFIWRENITPYKIVVSEIMLQQTQTSRVIEKFEKWIERFPDFVTLSRALPHDVLLMWQGLGYNRRGLALLKIAQIVASKHGGLLPQDQLVLQTFPAIGPNTAGSICAFAFNMPTVFIETNIRTVYTHTFFNGQSNVHDKQLFPLIEQTVDIHNAREWYYALMDYGVFLKKNIPAINSASKHYVKQSQFKGSKRQIRGGVVKFLTELKSIQIDALVDLLTFNFPENNHNFLFIIEQLIDEKIVHKKDNILFL